jgi:hypothetical protein
LCCVVPEAMRHVRAGRTVGTPTGGERMEKDI